MVSINSDINGYSVLKAAGVTPRAAMSWVGSWSGQSSIDSHLNACKQEGIIPAFQLYWWGDQISSSVILNGKTPDGRKTEAGWWALAKLLAERIKVSGVPEAWVIMETEWNKGSLTNDDAACAKFDKSIRDMQWTIVGIAPAAKIIAAPGSWSDPTTLYQKFPEMTKSIDIYGTQFMRCLTRNSAASYDSVPAEAIAYFKKVNAMFPGKQMMLTDLCLGTYGTARQMTHPFLPSGVGLVDGESYADFRTRVLPKVGDVAYGEEQRQAAVLNKLAAAKDELEQLGVTDIFVREPRDNMGRDPRTNYFGMGEWFFGVMRMDGSQKAGYGALITLAKPKAPPAPESVPKSEYDALKADYDAMKRLNDQLVTRLDAAQVQIVNQAETIQQAQAATKRETERANLIQSKLDELQARVNRFKQALADL